MSRALARNLLAAIAVAAIASVAVLVLSGQNLPAPTAGLALGLAAATAVVFAADRLRRGAASG